MIEATDAAVTGAVFGYVLIHVFAMYADWRGWI